jgi:hypothetical protein
MEYLMKKLLVTLVFVLSFSGNCHADSGVRDSLEKMFELTDMQAMLDSSYAQMDQIFSQMAKEKDIADDKKAIYEKHKKKFHAMLTNSMSWEKIKEPIIKAYSQVYTKAEIDELNVFYQSPLGQKMIKKMPELMQATMQVMQETTKIMIPKMQALQKELQAELSKQS